MLYLSTLLFLIVQEIIEIPEQFYISLGLFKFIGGHSPITNEVYNINDFYEIITNYHIDRIMDYVLLLDNTNANFPFSTNINSTSNISQCLEIGKEISQINNSLHYKLMFGINEIIYNNNNYTFASQSSQWCICDRCGIIEKKINDSIDHIQILIFSNSTDVNKINLILPNNTFEDQSTTIEILYDLNYQDSSMITRFDSQKGILYCPSETRCYWELLYIFSEVINYYNIYSSIITLSFLFIITTFIFIAVEDELFKNIPIF
uniref:Transmembrane protein n=1 Tax=Strongyloides venezuelensis TaxID=75913 RepID=A0A0K0G0I1_STRVS